RDSQVEPRLGQLGLEDERLSEAANGLPIPALLRQCAAEVDVRRGIVGREPRCVPVAGNRLLEASLILVSVALIEMRIRGCVALQPAARTQVRSEIALRIRIVRLQCQGVQPGADSFASLAL